MPQQNRPVRAPVQPRVPPRVEHNPAGAAELPDAAAAAAVASKSPAISGPDESGLRAHAIGGGSLAHRGDTVLSAVESVHSAGHHSSVPS